MPTNKPRWEDKSWIAFYLWFIDQSTATSENQQELNNRQQRNNSESRGEKDSYWNGSTDSEAILPKEKQFQANLHQEAVHPSRRKEHEKE